MTATQFESLTVTQPPLLSLSLSLSLGPRLFPRFLLVFLALLFSEIAAQQLDATIELPLSKSEKRANKQIGCALTSP